MSLIERAKLTEEEQDAVFAKYYRGEIDVTELIDAYGRARLGKALWTVVGGLWAERFQHSAASFAEMLERELNDARLERPPEVLHILEDRWGSERP